MGSSLHSALRLVVALGCSIAAASPLLAQQKFEAPPSFDPARIAGVKPKGSNYTLVNPVRSDGFLRIYNVSTPYGNFTVHGDAMLAMRLYELAALAELEKVSNSESFNKALLEAGLSPVKYAGNLIINPVQTIGNTFAGIGSVLGQFGSGLHNAGKTQDDPMAGLLGVTKKKRELAAKLGVDPYTDFEPLSVKLSRLSEAAAAGGLAVNAALMAIPGVAGIVVSNVSTSSDLSNLARDYSAAQLMDRNRTKLTAMGVEPAVIEAFLLNRAYTPLDAVALVDALESMAAVQGRPAFVSRAASVTGRDAAFFMLRHIQLVATFYRKTGGLTAFVPFGDFPFNQLREGGVVGIWPVDNLAWTQETARGLNGANAALKRAGHTGRRELRITGQATRLARQNLQAMGWTLVENLRP